MLLTCMKYIGGTKLDERIIRTDLDPGFQEEDSMEEESLVAKCATNTGRSMMKAEGPWQSHSSREVEREEEYGRADNSKSHSKGVWVYAMLGCTWPWCTGKYDSSFSQGKINLILCSILLIYTRSINAAYAYFYIHSIIHFVLHDTICCFKSRNCSAQSGG